MYSVETKVSFEAAHRLYDVNTYSEECRNNLHGHSYKVTVVVGRDELNDAGMVIDFKLLKKVIRENIENVYDHSCILKSNDPIASVISANCKKVHIVNDNPTAEWMSKVFREILETKLKEIDEKCKVISVAVQETENNIAISKIGGIK